MSAVANDLIGLAPVRDDFIPKDHYISRDFAALEKARLWPRVWQMACREEDLEKKGSYVTYDVADQSLLLVRDSAGDIRAFHNVCPHRGNKIMQGAGTTARLVCSFHGWEWDSAGKCIFIKDANDWSGCEHSSTSDMNLKGVRVALWGGFVFINMDPDCESFEAFIDPIPEYLDCIEFDKMRFSWCKTMKLRGNWKTTLESFMESYHVFTTHQQLMPYLDEISVSFVHGKHGKHGYPNAQPLGSPSARLNRPVPEDFRPGYIKALEELAIQTGGRERVGSGSGRSADAVRAIMDVLPASASALEVNMKGLELMREAALAQGAGWPEVTPEQMGHLGVDWNVFPNMVLVFAFDSTLVFRARPDGDDPNGCVFDMWGLFRFGEGKRSPVPREFYEDWRAHEADIPSLLVQDLRNIEKIQQGMRSLAFDGSRPNPIQERQISNHHKVLRRYLARA